MNKRIVGILILVVLTGCWRIHRDLSNSPLYSNVIGKQYKTKAELVVYRLSKNEYGSLSPFGSGPIPPTEELKAKPFPYRYYDTKVLGILPVGSVLEIVKVTEEGATNNAFVFYYTKVAQSSDPQWIGQINDVIDFTVNRDPLKLNPAIAEEIVP